MPGGAKRCDTFRCRHPRLVALAIALLIMAGLFGTGLGVFGTGFYLGMHADEFKEWIAAAKAGTEPDGLEKAPFSEADLEKDVMATQGGPDACVKCKMNEAHVGLYPCGHRSLCRGCYNTLHADTGGNPACPACEAPIEGRVFVYDA